MAKPISVEPSQGWDGNDGPWSTFAIRVGNPAQPLRVLASTTIPETWVAIPLGCTSQDGPNCASGRGNLYNQNISKTYKDQGLFQLGAERNLNFTDYDNGDYGFDTLALGYAGAGGVSLEQQVVAGIATKDFYLGFLGLTPRPVNFSLTESSPSFLSNLKNQSKIPSLSYGYSAGAYYHLKKVDGTLTLGGYDASRFTPNGVSLRFATDVARDLVVGLQSIQFSDSITKNKELLPSGGILAFVDSTVPHIWLPISACKAFESAFGITYDAQSELYLVNNTLHNTLLAQNANVTFILGNEIKGGDTIAITLPYLSFDLQASYLYLNATTRYFPLRRAANDTQYTLGRTFLQESYLIVDYERSNFSLSQSTFVEDAKQNLVPILSINDTSTTITKVPQHPPTHKKLSGGALAGIIVAGVILCILITGAIIFVIRRRRSRQAAKEASLDDQANTPSELNALAKPTLGELYAPHGEVEGLGVFKSDVEMEGSNPSLMGSYQRAEMEGSHGGVEMEGAQGGTELYAGNAAVELDGGPVPPAKLSSPAPLTRDPSFSGGERDVPAVVGWKTRENQPSSLGREGGGKSVVARNAGETLLVQEDEGEGGRLVGWRRWSDRRKGRRKGGG